MFPISEMAWIVLAGCFVHLASTACFLLASRFRPVAVLPAVAFVAFVYRMFRTDQGGGDYEGLGDLIAVVATGIAVALGAGAAALSGMLADRWASPTASALAGTLGAAGAAVTVAALALLGQHVPESRCSTESVDVEVGGAVYRIPIAFRASLEQDIPSSDRPRHFFYQPGHERKEGLRTICRQSREGTRPIPAERLRLGARSVARALSDACAPASATMGTCAGPDASRFAGIAEIEVTTRRSPYLEQWLEPPHPPDVLVGGDGSDGHLCFGRDDDGTVADCHVWRTLGGARLVVETSRDARGPVGAVLARARTAGELALQMLSPQLDPWPSADARRCSLEPIQSFA